MVFPLSELGGHLRFFPHWVCCAPALLRMNLCAQLPGDSGIRLASLTEQLESGGGVLRCGAGQLEELTHQLSRLRF